MTLQSPPAYVQAGVYSALSDRLHLVTVRTLRDFSLTHRARQGFYPDRFPAYSNPAGMGVTVGSGAGVIANTFASDAGDYGFTNPSNLTVTLAASSPTLNRIDIVGFQVKDNFYDASGLNSIIPAVLQGANSAGAPSDPTIPASFIPVVRATVNATVTSPTLADMRVKTVPGGAILPIGSDTERATIGTPSAGTTTWRTDKNRFETYTGATWLEGWGEPPLAQLRQTTVQLIPNVTFAAIQFQTEDRDTHNGHDNVTNNTRYTAQVAGTYEFVGCTTTAAGVGFRANYFKKNGAVVNASQNSGAANFAGATQPLTSRTLQIALAVGDYVELWLYQDTGGGLNTAVAGGEIQSHLSVKYIGA